MRRKFEERFHQIMEMMTADVGIGGHATSLEKAEDSYATGTTQNPVILGTGRKLFGRQSAKRTRKRRKHRR